MTPERQKGQGIQFETPVRMAAPPGKIFDLVSISGITRIKMVGDMQYEIESMPFTTEERTREQAVFTLHERLDEYVPNRLTELGTQDVTYEQISANAGAFVYMRPVRRAIRELLNFEKLERGSRRVNEDIREYLIGRGVTPTVHIGTPHPGVAKLIHELQAVVDSEQQRRERLAKRGQSS